MLDSRPRFLVSVSSVDEFLQAVIDKRNSTLSTTSLGVARLCEPCAELYQLTGVLIVPEHP